MCSVGGMDRHELLKRFEGVVDDETLKLLSLYAMGDVRVEAEVKTLKVYPGKAVLELFSEELEVEFRAFLQDLRKLLLVSPGSKVVVTGRFAGDSFRVSSIDVVEPRTFTFEGKILASKKLDDFTCLCISDGKSCFACLTDISVNGFCEVRGAKADNFVILAEVVKPAKFRNIQPFVPVTKASEGRVCVSGRISGIGELKKGKREFASLYISDKSGRAKLILWDSLEVYRKADIGDRLEVFGCVFRNGVFHCDSFTILRLERGVI